MCVLVGLLAAGVAPPTAEASHAVTKTFTATQGLVSSVASSTELTFAPSDPEFPVTIQVRTSSGQPVLFGAYQEWYGGPSVYGCGQAALTGFKPDKPIHVQIQPDYPPYYNRAPAAGDWEFALVRQLDCPVRVLPSGAITVTYADAPQPLPLVRHYVPGPVAGAVMFHATGFAPVRIDVADKLGGPVRFGFCIDQNNNGWCTGDPVLRFCGRSATLTGLPADKMIVAWVDNYPGGYPCPQTALMPASTGSITLSYA